ncbi:MAG: multicopper oxidase domain-containing protein [Gemmatimonadetes bacterium]|nr:multicopper oxidase domain-containing protein [Gemmatimonadota bacterium]
MRFSSALLSLLVAFMLVACGGGTDEGTMEDDTLGMMEADTAMGDEDMDAGMGAMSMPTWMQMDETARTVSMDITAGESDVNNRWNFNGLYAGNGRIVVPEGYTVTINFTNADPTQPHSLGIEETMATWPATFETPEPVFEGAITPDAGTTGTGAGGGTATVTFTTGAAGDYAMVCYIAGHAVAGMVVPFTVSADGSAGAEQ